MGNISENTFKNRDNRIIEKLAEKNMRIVLCFVNFVQFYASSSEIGNYKGINLYLMRNIS